MGMQLECTGGEGGGTQWVCVPNAPCCSPCGVQNKKGALTPENLTAAYQKVYGSAPSQDWLNLTCKAYSQSGSNSCSVLSNLAFCKGLKCASSALGISNNLGNQGCFTTGAAKLQQMGATPTGPSYEGVPTSFQLNGKTYQYGSVGNSRCSNSFGWVDTSSLPKCVNFGTAKPVSPQDWSNAEMFGLGALGLAGAAAFAPALTSGTSLTNGALGTEAAYEAGLPGAGQGADALVNGVVPGVTPAMTDLSPLSAEVLPVADASLIPGTPLGAAPAMTDAAVTASGLTLSNLLKAGIPLAQAIGTILGGKSPIGGGSGSGSGGGSGSGSGSGSGANSTAAQLASMTPDTSAQIFRVGQTAKDPLAKVVTQPITELTPEYKNIQQTYGCAQTAAKGGLIGGLGHYASGGSTSKNLFCFKDSEPKFDDQRPELLMGRGSNSKVEPMVLKQIKPGISGYARGGLPEKYHAATPEGHHPEFITGLTGYYACGGGTGQSDDIPAMLHDGDYVMDAETVSALGDGSSKAGMHVLEGFRSQVPYKNAPGDNPVPAKIADGEYVFPAAFVSALGRGDNKRGSEILDGLREKLRAHKRGAPLDKIPPKAKSPLDYIQKGKK